MEPVFDPEELRKEVEIKTASRLKRQQNKDYELKQEKTALASFGSKLFPSLQLQCRWRQLVIRVLLKGLKLFLALPRRMHCSSIAGSQQLEVGSGDEGDHPHHHWQQLATDFAP